MKITIEDALTQGGAGTFQKRLLGIFGLVWAADAMQVIAVGFAAPSIMMSFGVERTTALQVGTLFFVGMFVGAFIFGRVADAVGRRSVLLITVSADAVVGLASAFAPNFELLLVLRFLTGIAVGGTLPVDYAMMAEFLPPKNRGRWLVILEGFWAIGTIIVALTAWIAVTQSTIPPWRWVFFISALPALIGVFLRIWVPESPMYLLKSNRHDAARAVIDRILKANNAPPLGEDTELTMITPPEGGPSSIFAYKLLRPTLGIITVWFLVSLAYYGIFVWVPGWLANEGIAWVRGYGFLVILALAQIPGYVLAAYSIERWGRRPTLLFFLLLSALACFLFTLSLNPIMVAISLIVMSFSLLGCWGALYAFTPELYPTNLRGTGMGTASAVARLGGILAPTILAFAFARGLGFAIGILATFLVLAAFTLLVIKTETRDRAIG